MRALMAIVFVSLSTVALATGITPKEMGGGGATSGEWDLDTNKLYGDKSADSNTYIYRSGADEFTLVAGGVAIAIYNGTTCTIAGQLAGVTSVDATTETTLESAIDTLGALTCTGDTTYQDTKKVCLGTGCNYWMTYNNTGTQWEVWTTNGNGAGLDTLMMAVDDGTSTVDFETAASVTGTFIALDSISMSTAGKMLYQGFTAIGSIMLATTAQTNDVMAFQTGTTGNYFIVYEYADRGTDFGLAQQTNPTWVIQSADAASPTKRVYFAHNQTDAVYATDSGDHRFTDDSGKGTASYIRTKHESVTFAAAPGDGSKVTTGSIIPAGAFVTGVSGRVTTSNTGGCTSMDIGIAAKDTDAFGDGIAVTQNTVFTHANGNAGADWSNVGLGIIPSMAAQEITVTAVGGDAACDAMVVALAVHYIDASAATAN